MKKLTLTLLTLLTVFSLACSYMNKPTTPAMAGTMPTISELAPNSMSHGGSAFVMTVNGHNFSSTAWINFNGVAETTTYVTGNQLMATIPASAIAAAGTVPVTVTNPSTTGMGAYGSGGMLSETSSPMNFMIN